MTNQPEEHNPFDLGTPPMPGYEISNANANNDRPPYLWDDKMKEVAKKISKSMEESKFEETWSADNIKAYTRDFIEDKFIPKSTLRKFIEENRIIAETIDRFPDGYNQCLEDLKKLIK